MVSETATNEQIQEETKQLFTDPYFYKDPKMELQKEKLQLIKRLKEIDFDSGNEEKRQEILKKEIARRRIRYNRMQQEQQLNKSQVELFWSNRSQPKNLGPI